MSLKKRMFRSNMAILFLALLSLLVIMRSKPLSNMMMNWGY